MAENSKIEWCDHTFNPFIGCTKVSPGCDNCYAEQLMDKRMHKVVWGTKERVRTSPANWRKPLHWNAVHGNFLYQHGRRQRVFCASLADVFDNAVDPQWRTDLFDLIKQTPNLDWLLLTKRIGNVPVMLGEIGVTHLPWNVWLGSTIVNQEEANRDIPKLLAISARVRFLSMEPLLGPVDLERPMPGPDIDQGGGAFICQPWMIQSGIDWVIVGGESGHGARPMHQAWARSLRNQCADAGVPFLFKQWGEWAPGNRGPGDDLSERDRTRCKSGFFTYNDDWIEGGPNPFRQTMDRIGKKAAGRQIDGQTHDEFPRGA